MIVSCLPGKEILTLTPLFLILSTQGLVSGVQEALFGLIFGQHEYLRPEKLGTYDGENTLLNYPDHKLSPSIRLRTRSITTNFEATFAKTMKIVTACSLACHESRQMHVVEPILLSKFLDMCANSFPSVAFEFKPHSQFVDPYSIDIISGRQRSTVLLVSFLWCPSKTFLVPLSSLGVPLLLVAVNRKPW